MGKRELYVLHVLTTAELDIKKKLEKDGYTAYVPTEIRLERRRGKWERKEIILIPGYVFVYVALYAYRYKEIREIPGVIKFLGSEGPQALTDCEVEEIEWVLNNGCSLEPSRIVLEQDGSIKVISGPLVGLEDQIAKLNTRQKKVSVIMEFGEENPRYVTMSADFI